MPTDDAAIAAYDPSLNNYDLALDPRCLWGWGGCGCMFGHACFRPLGHPGKCWDAGRPKRPGDLPCQQRQRPKNWDAKGRAEANR